MFASARRARRTVAVGQHAERRATEEHACSVAPTPTPTANVSRRPSQPYCSKARPPRPAGDGPRQCGLGVPMKTDAEMTPRCCSEMCSAPSEGKM